MGGISTAPCKCSLVGKFKKFNKKLVRCPMSIIQLDLSAWKIAATPYVCMIVCAWKYIYIYIYIYEVFFNPVNLE